jgi:hypothetical protein
MLGFLHSLRWEVSIMRQPKPSFRKQTKSWYVQIDGKQINLGTRKRDAWNKYHENIAGGIVSTNTETLAGLLGAQPVVRTSFNANNVQIL